MYPGVMMYRSHGDPGPGLSEDQIRTWPTAPLPGVALQDGLGKGVGAALWRGATGAPQAVRGHPDIVVCDVLAIFPGLHRAHSPFIRRLMSEISAAQRRRSACSRRMISSWDQ